MASVDIKKQNNVLQITLDRPDKHNAFNPEMISELTSAFLSAASDPELRAVLLSGRGKSFCSGADLAWMKSMVNFSVEENQRDSEALFSMFEAARQCPVPIVGRMHGHVLGGAVGLAAICDVVVAHEETKFCFSEVRLGLVPAVICPFVLKKMQASAARELMLTGKVFSASEAQASGLVQYVGSEEETNASIEKVLHRLSQCGPEALRETKKLLSFVGENSWDKVRKQTAQVISERRVSSEGQEGLKSFFEKRDPAWRQS